MENVASPNFKRVFQAASATFLDGEAAVGWILAPSELLDFRAPVEILGTSNGLDALLKLLDAMRSLKTLFAG